MSITFKDLENFVAVASSTTLSEASEKLEMAQPSLSLSIKKLEGELKIPLFIRSRSGIKLTPQGRKALPEAEGILQLLSKIKGSPTKLSFKIGCHPSVGMFMLGDFLKEMEKYRDHFDLTIVNDSSNEINKMVASGEIDFGLVMNPLPIQGLVTKLIGEDDVVVWESEKRYSDRLIFNPSMLQASAILSRWKNPPEKRIEVANLELIASLVNSGAGMGILPAQVVKSLGFILKRFKSLPTYKDKLALVCYPEILRSNEGKSIFDGLKKSFRPLRF